MKRNVSASLLVWVISGAGEAADCSGSGRDWLPPILLDIEAPQGIAIDPEDGSLWICSGIDAAISRVGRDLTPSGTIELPFATRNEQFLGGIAYRDDADTLLVSFPALGEIRELDRDGNPTGLVIRPNLPRPPTLDSATFLKGLAYNAQGDGGRGSVWVIESVMTAAYELTLEGDILGSFCTPDDPDGCPGEGAASGANDIALVRDGAGDITGFEITTGRPHRDRIWRLDAGGAYHGNWVLLADAGGNLGGFESGEAVDRSTGESRQVLWVTIESKAELHALDITEPRLLGIEGLAAAADPAGMALVWTAHGDYDSIEVRRDGVLIATLAPDAASYLDPSPPDGILQYEVTGIAGECRAQARATTVVGAGAVLRQAEFPGFWAIDLAEDGGGFLWVTDSRNQLVVYDKELTEVVRFPGPFPTPGEETGGIAYNPVRDTLFVYNASTNLIAEINTSGELVRPPFSIGIVNDPEQPAAAVASLSYNPAGAAGAGSFWLLDASSGRIEERDEAGALLGHCAHPDHAREPPPPGGRLGAYIFGLCESPGTDFDELHISGGSVRDGRATRIVRITSACVELGEEISPAGVAAATGNGYLLALHRTEHAGKDVFFVIDSLPYRSRILELETRPPPVQAVRLLSCTQPTDSRAVALSFTPIGAHDGVAIARDGIPLSTLPAGSTSHVDDPAPAGLHEYSVRSLRGGEESDERTCAVQVGVGSRARREFAGGLALLTSLSPDPGDGSYLAASSLFGLADELYRFDGDLRLVGSIPAPFRAPEQTAALAVRQTGGGVEIYCVGWRPGAPSASKELPLSVIDRDGAFLRRHTIAAPAPRGGFVSYPAGLAHDSATDTFWLHERNAFAVLQLAADGTVLRQLAHPAPPHQYKVENFGIAVDAERGVLLLSTGGRLDHKVTRLVEMTRSGQLTGVEIPVGAPDYTSFAGFALVPGSRDVVAAAVLDGAVWDLVRFRAHDPVPPVRNLACELGLEGSRLSWTDGGAYDEVQIYRRAELVATVSAGAGAWADPDVPGAVSFYRVVGVSGELVAAGVVCEVDPGVFFVRGDVEENGEVNITDAIATLLYLFSGGDEPRCLDAADTDDSGDINITDAVALLGYLFTSGRPPAPPFPARGIDATEDAMRCGG